MRKSNTKVSKSTIKSRKNASKPKKAAAKKTTKKVNWMKVDEVDPKEYLEVKIVTDGSDKIGETLGISDDRLKEIEKVAENAYKSTTTITAAAVMVSKEMKHANELFYGSFILATIRHHQHHNPLAGIMQIVIGGRKREEGEG